MPKSDDDEEGSNEHNYYNPSGIISNRPNYKFTMPKTKLFNHV